MPKPETIILESSSSHLHTLVKRLIVLPYEAIVTLWAFLIFWLVMVLALPIAWLLARTHPEHPKSAVALFARRIFRLYLYLTGVRLVLENAQHLPKGDDYAVFAANHASFVDGLLWGAIYNRRVFALILPPGYVPWPMDLWLVKSGSIPVARSEEERSRFPDLVWGERAVQATVTKMTGREKSVLIFPEGHVERKRSVLKFHTGAVRVALEAGVPIIPLTIRNAERVFSPNKFILWPGTITFRLHRPMDLTQYYGKQGNHALVRRLTEQLRSRIVRDLPSNYEIDPE